MWCLQWHFYFPRKAYFVKSLIYNLLKKLYFVNVLFSCIISEEFYISKHKRLFNWICLGSLMSEVSKQAFSGIIEQTSAFHSWHPDAIYRFLALSYGVFSSFQLVRMSSLSYSHSKWVTAHKMNWALSEELQVLYKFGALLQIPSPCFHGKNEDVSALDVGFQTDTLPKTLGQCFSYEQ